MRPQARGGTGPPPQGGQASRVVPPEPATAAAVGLVEGYAAAFVSGVPDRPEDDGFFGPGSVTWRLAADLSAPVAGLRSVLIQALHPLAMAGLTSTATGGGTRFAGGRHLRLRRDPDLRRPGQREPGRPAGPSDPRARPGHGHRDRPPYAARHPALLLWVHAALVDSVLAAARLFGTPPAAAGRRPYVARWPSRPSCSGSRA